MAKNNDMPSFDWVRKSNDHFYKLGIIDGRNAAMKKILEVINDFNSETLELNQELKEDSENES